MPESVVRLFCSSHIVKFDVALTVIQNQSRKQSAVDENSLVTVTYRDDRFHITKLLEFPADFVVIYWLTGH